MKVIYLVVARQARFFDRWSSQKSDLIAFSQPQKIATQKAITFFLLAD